MTKVKAIKHPHFDLWFHDDESLSEELGIPVVERETIHDWPLSSVQKIHCDDGSVHIYKTQRYATVEVEFYQRARSSILPKFQYLGEINGCQALILEYIQGTRVSNLKLNVRELLDLAARLQREVDAIEGSFPAYTNIGQPDKWIAFVDSTLDVLAQLVNRRVFTSLNGTILQKLRQWAESQAVLELIENTSCFIHGDPTGDNIFLVKDELRVIDWQRPRIAPRDVDVTAILEAKGIDPRQHIDAEAVKIFHFLRINWLAMCKSIYFTAGKSYESQIIEAADILLGI